MAKKKRAAAASLSRPAKAPARAATGAPGGTATGAPADEAEEPFFVNIDGSVVSSVDVADCIVASPELRARLAEAGVHVKVDDSAIERVRRAKERKDIMYKALRVVVQHARCSHTNKYGDWDTRWLTHGLGATSREALAIVDGEGVRDRLVRVAEISVDGGNGDQAAVDRGLDEYERVCERYGVSRVRLQLEYVVSRHPHHGSDLLRRMKPL